MDTRTHTTSDALRERFTSHMKQWWSEIAWLSGGDAIFDNLHYQAIIAMGAEAVPLLLEEMQRSPLHLGYALREITGENPVLDEHAGNVGAIAQDWLSWGKAHGYV